jgi:hypothetical protein
MKTKHYLLIVFAAFLLFFQGSCEKDEDGCPIYKLPEATKTGENTFGCMINDNVFVPRAAISLFAPAPKKFSYNEETGDIYFFMSFFADDLDYQCGFPDITFKMEAYEVFSTGEVEKGKYWATISYYPVQYESGKGYQYNNNLPDLSAKLEITKLDTIENIISGIFQFEAYRSINNYNPEDKLFVTEGRFDFTYNQDGSRVEGYSN